MKTEERAPTISTGSCSCPDLHKYAGRNYQPIQCFHGPRIRLEDVDDALVRPHLELLAGLLIHVRAAKDSVALDPRRKRDRTMHAGAGAPGMFDDLAR